MSNSSSNNNNGNSNESHETTLKMEVLSRPSSDLPMTASQATAESDADALPYFRKRIAGEEGEDEEALPVDSASTSGGSTTRLVRRSAILQYEQLVALANSLDSSITECDEEADKVVPAPVDSKWSLGSLFRKKRPYNIALDGPLHKDIDTLFLGVRHPPLSKEELNAFYIYSAAVQPVVVVVFTALSTVVLQNLAAGAGMEASNHTQPCNYTVPNYKCVTNIGGAWIDPSSFSLYTTAASVLLQAVFFVSLGALADHGSIRKKFMIGFMGISVLMCASMISIRQSTWFLAASILVIFGQLTFGASFCFYNSYMPVLSAVHWDVLSAPEETREKVYEATLNTVSAISNVYGYVGAVMCFALAGGSVFLLQLVPASTGFGDYGFFDSLGVQTFSMQVGILVAATWALIGLYWPLKYIRDRPYDPLPKGTNYIMYSWQEVFKTVSRARKMPNTFLMLLSWFMLSDAISTVGSTTILFATADMGFTSTEILVLAIAAPLTAAGGNYLWLRIQRKFNYSTKRMLMMLVLMAVLLPVYGMLGFFLPFGLKNKWELFPAGVVYGCLLGAIQSFSRVMFSDLVPRGKEGEFFALYAITDKGSSWIGPLAVGAITDATHEIRYGFIFLFFMLLLSVGCISFVNVEKGKRDAERFNVDNEDLKNLHSTD